jgi:serine/threonine protein kinase
MATPERGEKAIFNAARRIETPEARRRYLEQACADQPDLHARILALLRIHDQELSFLESPAPGLHVETVDTLGEGPGTHIGPYRLVEVIGEGGFGVVFRAEQHEPLRRQVALKVLKPGMDTRRVVARFEAERQALALMDHPHIARILEGGETAAGRPYFVMELVYGVPITLYCDDHNLPLRQRLGLFVAVCQAVQHAHQKGIIHRDLKPSNVLVASEDGKLVPKVIDFGVAKALGQPLSEGTLATGAGVVVGTLAYMSPEQTKLDALDIDTRADIYSLGVVLYELLTGTTPLTRERLKQTDLGEVLRLIREEEPPPPSARLNQTNGSLTSLEAQRKQERACWSREVRDELDWIVMKALEKDRGRRYETASAFAADVQRYLAGEPVLAAPPSATYRLRKFARKHRAALTTAALVALLLVAGVAVSTWQAVRATAAEARAHDKEQQALVQKQRADDEAAIARAITDFLQKELLGQADISLQVGGERNSNITVREVLDRAAQQIDGKFPGQKLTEAAIRFTIGSAYVALGE